jgi:hypothetical protein
VASPPHGPVGGGRTTPKGLRGGSATPKRPNQKNPESPPVNVAARTASGAQLRRQVLVGTNSGPRKHCCRFNNELGRRFLPVSFVEAEPNQLKLRLLVVRWDWIFCNVGAMLAMKHKLKLVVWWAWIWWCGHLHGAKCSLVSGPGKQCRERANTPRPRWQRI